MATCRLVEATGVAASGQALKDRAKFGLVLGQPHHELLLGPHLVGQGGHAVRQQAQALIALAAGGFGTGDGASGRLRTGIGTVLDGSAVGLGLFARVAVLLAVVGGITVVIQTALSTWLVSSLLWLSGRTLLAVVVLGGCCVGLGVTLPVVAGYATGAVVVVPLFVTLTAVPDLTAHLLVWYAVVGGWLVAPAVDQQLRRLGDQW